MRRGKAKNRTIVVRIEARLVYVGALAITCHNWVARPPKTSFYCLCKLRFSGCSRLVPAALVPFCVNLLGYTGGQCVKLEAPLEQKIPTFFSWLSHRAHQGTGKNE